MIKTIKRVVLSSLSILGISLILWSVVLLNPGLSYANKTQFEHVTVYHNQTLDNETEAILKNVIHLIKQSDLFTSETNIRLCLNDDKFYPSLNPLAGQCLAYAYLDLAVLKNGDVDFSRNVIETKWAINNFEHRKFDLTYLLAHEFMHNLQFQTNRNYAIKSTLGSINWKFEGHADYIARKAMNDGKLKEKIAFYLLEEQKTHNGLPVFQLEDGTMQILSYQKYALAVQYLYEEKGVNFDQLCQLETGLDIIFEEMVDWSEK